MVIEGEPGGGWRDAASLGVNRTLRHCAAAPGLNAAPRHVSDATGSSNPTSIHSWASCWDRNPRSIHTPLPGWNAHAAASTSTSSDTADMDCRAWRRGGAFTGPDLRY